MSTGEKNHTSEAQKHRAESIEDRLRDQGVGQDEAKKRAIEQARQEIDAGGGKNGGGETPKGT